MECEWKWFMPIPGLASKNLLCNHTVLSFQLADWVGGWVGGWMGEVVDSNKTLEDSGSTWWKMSAQEYGMQVEQSYSVK